LADPPLTELMSADTRDVVASVSRTDRYEPRAITVAHQPHRLDVTGPVIRRCPFAGADDASGDGQDSLTSGSAARVRSASGIRSA
jgi:hypothetical protein